MTAAYLVENSHEAADGDLAFDSLEETVAASEASVRDDTLLCTCPHGYHGGTIVVEAEEPARAESFARRWNVGETIVKQLTEMEVG